MDIHHIISAVTDFAAKTGQRPEQVCRKATGNPRLLQRLQRRAAQTESDWRRLEKLMLSDAQHEQNSTVPIVTQVNGTGTLCSKRIFSSSDASAGAAE
jgi:ferritin-like metal-binding protein YciE